MLDNSSIEYKKIYVDDNPEVAVMYGIKKVPVFIVSKTQEKL